MINAILNSIANFLIALAEYKHEQFKKNGYIPWY